MVPGSIV